MKQVFFLLVLALPALAQLVLAQSALAQTLPNFNPNAPGQTNSQNTQNPANNNVPAPPPVPVDGRKVRARYNALAQAMNARQVPADAQNMALLRFKMEQAYLWISAVDNNTAWPEEAMRYAQDAIARAESVARAKGDAVYPAATQEHERAYIAENDGTVQPYWIYVPKGYTPQKQYPLVVFLHGFSPDITKISPWVPHESIWSLATDRGFIFAVPYGRRNTDFVGIGEDDTIIVTEAVKSRYNVDPDRVFLMGASMGGYGAYAVGLHRPDYWAGIMPIAARSDFYRWFGLERQRVPWWKRVLYDANDPRHLVGNALNVPMFIQHGELDNINDVAHARDFYADAKAAGNPIKYREVRGGDHYIYFDMETYTLPLDWALTVTRNPGPKKVRYATVDLKNHRAYWAEVKAFQDYSRGANLSAEINTTPVKSIINVQAQNIARFQLQPPKAALKENLPLSLVVNGAPDERTFKIGDSIAWPAETTAEGAETIKDEFPGVKSPTRIGPVKNSYRDPFLVVCGTLKNPPGAKPNPLASDELAARFVKEWAIYADGIPRIKADTAVTEEDKRNYNLILFGTRETNAVLAAIADKLPLELLADGYRVGTKKITVEKPDEIGLQFCYPSPFDVRRMVVVQSGLPWGEELRAEKQGEQNAAVLPEILKNELPDNHKFDLIPDYIVFDASLEPGAAKHLFDYTDETNRALLSGFFDSNWQLKN